MKKTLIALMALAGIASAADLVAEWKDFSSLTSGDYSISLGNGGSKVEDGILSVSGILKDATVDLSAAELTIKDGFTVSITLSSVTHIGGNRPDNVFALKTEAGTNGDANHAFALSYRNDWPAKPLFFAYSGGTGNVKEVTDNGNIDQAGYSLPGLMEDTPITLTVTVESTTAKLYVDGELAYTGLISSNSVLEQEITTLALGSWAGTSGNGRQSETVYNLAIYNGAMSAAEVKAMLVPEPTTATLSLLALAGLAARRRRK